MSRTVSATPQYRRGRQHRRGEQPVDIEQPSLNELAATSGRRRVAVDDGREEHDGHPGEEQPEGERVGGGVVAQRSKRDDYRKCKRHPEPADADKDRINPFAPLKAQLECEVLVEVGQKLALSCRDQTRLEIRVQNALEKGRVSTQVAAGLLMSRVLVLVDAAEDVEGITYLISILLKCE
ncbi:hypothetical protein PgNI_11500 [Pyricularia grisea]|uniref:Uncharacterized protein n=1 Tax=Pyricularia grisea TaxID=148305 RepID=A0A6P8APK1_PYRGI|nr:hypothetical protein PgNI_11500 [Pyricularia grisea]TLD03953.1 hypothetical protein PgNI_11500 [Pyricularia grisea]